MSTAEINTTEEKVGVNSSARDKSSGLVHQHNSETLRHDKKGKQAHHILPGQT